MAVSNINVRIGVDSTQFTKGLAKAQTQLRRAGRNMENIGRSIMTNMIAPMTAFGTASVLAFNKQAKAEAQLRTALQGNEEAFERLTLKASEFQSQSLYTDEDIIQQMAFLQTMNLTEEQITSLIQASMNLATGANQTLEFGVRNLAKTFGGLTGELGEILPQLKNLTKEQLESGEAIDYVNEAFKNQAKAVSEVGTGPLIQVINALKDLTETVGEQLEPELDKLTETLLNLSNRLKEMPKEDIQFMIKSFKLLGEIALTFFIFGKIFKIFGKLAGVFKKMPKFISATRQQFVNLGNFFKNYKSVFSGFGKFFGLSGAVVGAGKVASNKMNKETEDTKDLADATDKLVKSRTKLNTINLESVAFTGLDTQQNLQLKDNLFDVDAEIEAEKINKLKSAILDAKETFTGVAENISMSFANTFSELIVFGGNFVNTMKDMFKSIINMILKMIIQALVLAGIMQLVKGGQFGTNFANALGGNFSLGTRASGGPVFAGQSYLVGEQGPEILTMGSASGNIIPNHQVHTGGVLTTSISGNDLQIILDKNARIRQRR